MVYDKTTFKFYTYFDNCGNNEIITNGDDNDAVMIKAKLSPRNLVNESVVELTLSHATQF